MTRANLLELAERIGLYADEPGCPPSAIVGDMRDRIEFIGFDARRDRRARTDAGRHHHRRRLRGADARSSPTRAPTSSSTWSCEENVRAPHRPGRRHARTSSRPRSTGSPAALERKSREIAEFKTANVEALPDSLEARRSQQVLEQERLLALEREEAALRNQRATVVWVFERTGRATGTAALSPEEEELEALKSELLQQRTIYAPTSPQIRLLENRIAALEALVDGQRAERARCPTPTARAGAARSSELDLELAPIDARLELHRRGEGDDRADARRAREPRSRRPRPTRWCSPGSSASSTTSSSQYDAAVANLGQAEVGERIEVLSKGERFSLIEQPTEPATPASPEPPADRQPPASSAASAPGWASWCCWRCSTARSAGRSS